MTAAAPTFTAEALADLIASRLDEQAEALRAQWAKALPVRHFVVDGLLPDDLAKRIFASAPPVDGLLHRDSLRERKKVGIHLEDYDPVVGAALLCFQNERVVSAVARVIGSDDLHPDPSLYASGMSVMERDDFLNPHVDNSHDGDRRRYRALNLLYYVTPAWREADGGNLELWTPALDVPTTVPALFNRLVVMQTNRTSWHSVSRVEADAARWCVSNYYFSDGSPDGVAYSNVTTFAGRPEERLKRVLLRLDGIVLNAAGRLFPFLTKITRHRRRDE